MATIPVDQHAFYQPLRSYTKRAIEFLAERCPQGQFHSLGLESWARGTDGVFRKEERLEPPWIICFAKHMAETQTWDEYRIAAEALRSDPTIRPQVGRLVGAGGSLHHEEVVDRLVWQVPSVLKALRFDEEAFRQEAQKLLDDLYRNQLQFVLLAPIRGLRLERAPLQLEPRVALDHFTDSEIGRCLDIGFLPDPLADRMPIRDIEQLAGVRVQYTLAKVTGTSEPKIIEEIMTVKQRASDSALGVLQALRLFKSGTISLAGLLERSQDWPMRGSMQYTLANPGTSPWSHKYDLSKQEEAALLELWANWQRASVKKIVARALRRFSYAAERERSDDRLVDLIIAAESLFLGGSDDPRDRGEMRHKLSLRAAYFIESDEFTRLEVLRFMRSGYDVRSAIVHGAADPDPKDLRSPKGVTVPLHEFVGMTEAMLRLALKKAINIATGTSGPLMNWDAALLTQETLGDG